MLTIRNLNLQKDSCLSSNDEDIPVLKFEREISNFRVIILHSGSLCGSALHSEKSRSNIHFHSITTFLQTLCSFEYPEWIYTSDAGYRMRARHSEPRNAEPIRARTTLRELDALPRVFMRRPDAQASVRRCRKERQYETLSTPYSRHSNLESVSVSVSRVGVCDCSF